MTYQRYHGSCHCQAVKYEASLDLAEGSNRCNCSLCSKARAWFGFTSGEHFRLVQGEDALSHYRWTPPGRTEPGLDYAFCSHCGIRLYATGDAPQMGGRFYAIHMPTLDDVDPEALAAAPLHYRDGAHDRFDRAPEDVRLM
ncbi:MAG: GFA family protein [Burkholderiaceae bacterium]